jgi:hypothetical protein
MIDYFWKNMIVNKKPAIPGDSNSQKPLLPSFILRTSYFILPNLSFILHPSSYILLLLFISGCQTRVDTHYGQRQGPGPTESVNGTSVLGEMFSRAGHTVYSWHFLSPRLRERADCIVWFPDDYQPPAANVRQWLEAWLADKPGRTLIYVGRDFDAGLFYWKKVLPSAPPVQTPLIQGEIAFEQSRIGGQRSNLPTKEDCEWFALDSTVKSRQVKTLAGDPAWLEGVDPAKVEIELKSRLAPSENAKILLASKDDALVSGIPWQNSRLIVVANGSFLLNVPLVNREHRKLAGKLIDEIGPPGRKVVFLESGSGGPPIRDKDPTLGSPTGLEIFNLWPTNWILLHLSAAGVLFCFVRWPIFGRPRRLKRVAESDFGRHIAAEAELLKRSGDRTYATARLLHYRQSIGEMEKKV